ncbi:hypothetical protein [Fluviispira multicolorata]|nr:hypothetical protein [Fluviispira multicolorata]
MYSFRGALYGSADAFASVHGFKGATLLWIKELISFVSAGFGSSQLIGKL